MRPVEVPGTVLHDLIDVAGTIADGFDEAEVKFTINESHVRLLMFDPSRSMGMEAIMPLANGPEAPQIHIHSLGRLVAACKPFVNSTSVTITQLGSVTRLTCGTKERNLAGIDPRNDSRFPDRLPDESKIQWMAHPVVPSQWITECVAASHGVASSDMVRIKTETGLVRWIHGDESDRFEDFHAVQESHLPNVPDSQGAMFDVRFLGLAFDCLRPARLTRPPHAKPKSKQSKPEVYDAIEVALDLANDAPMRITYPIRSGRLQVVLAPRIEEK